MLTWSIWTAQLLDNSFKNIPLMDKIERLHYLPPKMTQLHKECNRFWCYFQMNVSWVHFHLKKYKCCSVVLGLTQKYYSKICQLTARSYVWSNQKANWFRWLLRDFLCNLVRAYLMLYVRLCNSCCVQLNALNAPKCQGNCFAFPTRICCCFCTVNSFRVTVEIGLKKDDRQCKR